MGKDPYPFDQIPWLSLQQQQVLNDVEALHENDAFSLKNFTLQERSFLYSILKINKSDKNTSDLLKRFTADEIAGSVHWDPFVSLLQEEVPLKPLVTCHEEELNGPEEWEKWALYLIQRLQHAQEVLLATGGADGDEGLQDLQDLQDLGEEDLGEESRRPVAAPEKATP